MTTISPTSSPPLSPALSTDDSRPFHMTLDRSSSIITHPFPSPGSAFVPPPKPGLHEFTLPQSKRPKKNSSVSPSSTPGEGTNNVSTSITTHGNRGSTPTNVEPGSLPNGAPVPPTQDRERGSTKSEPASDSFSSTQPPHTQSTSSSADAMLPATNTVQSKASSLSLNSGRATPTPSNTAGHVAPDYHSPATAIPNPRTSSASSASSKQTQTPVTSSRPAPPSPAPSRTPSQSRGGSRRQSRLPSASAISSNSPMNPTSPNGTTTPSRRLSTLSNFSATSNPNQNKRLSTLSNISTLPTVPQSQVASSATAPPPSALPSTAIPPGQILIRDFAFVIADKRHTGEGADAPKVIKKMQKKYGPPSVRKPEKKRDSISVSSSCASSESGSRRGSGFGFGWGPNASGGLGGWWSGVWSGFGNGSGSRSRNSKVFNRQDEDVFTPTLNDLSRNFNTSSSSPAASQPASPGVIAQGEGDLYDDVDGAEAPLLPGLYKALYDFIPEGTAEMGLREGDIVRVAGEGGGVGWAVVVRGTIRFTDDGEEIIDYVAGGGSDSTGTGATDARAEDLWALVPQSYLEVWRLDRNDDDEGHLGDNEE